MPETVLIDRADGVVEIRLNRPQKKNALVAEMYDAISAELSAGCQRDDVRVFLIAAEGDAFCAGNDISEFLHGGPNFSDSAPARFVNTLANCSKPLVAAVQGLAVGVGMTMLLHCDLVYAAPEARLSVPFVSMGLTPEAGSSLIMPRLFGPQIAARLLLLGEAITAAEAHTAGLVCEVIPAAALRLHARAKAAALAARAPAALAASRALLRGERNELQARMEREFDVFAQALRGPEAREALTAFLEKRPARFAVEPATAS